MADMTLTQILFKLAAFLPADDAVAIVEQIDRLMPSDVSANIVADMNTGADLTLAALAHVDPEHPKLFTASPEAYVTHRGSSSLDDFLQGPESTLGTKLDLLQQMYPARAAALYLRVLLNIVANLFEQNAMHALSGDLLHLLITGLLRAEAILDARCMDCPKLASTA